MLPIVLRILGWLGVLAAALTLVVGAFVVRPRAETVVAQASQTWSLASRALELAHQSSGILDPSFEALQRGLQLSTLLPETLSATSGALLQGAGTLDVTATSLDALQSGITGLVTPGSVGRNATQARKSADQLRLLGKMVADVRDDSIGMRAQGQELARMMTQVRRNVPELTALMRQASDQARSGLESLEVLPISALVIGISAGVSLIFLLLGVLLLGMAEVSARLARSGAILELQRQVHREAA
jgi:hypothetical protein